MYCSCATLSPSSLFKACVTCTFELNTLTIDSSICLTFSFWVTIPKTSFNEPEANLKTLNKSFAKIATNATAPGPVKILPIPLTIPFAKELPSSSPPPRRLFISSTLSPKNPTMSPSSGFMESSPMIPTSSFRPVPA